MPWYENLRVAATALWANRLRTVLTMLGLIIGVGAVIMVLAIGIGSQKFVREQFSSFGTNILIVGEDESGRAVRPLTVYDMEAMRTQIGAVDRASGLMAAEGRAVWNSKNADARMYGVEPELARMLNWTLVKGRFFSEQEVRERAHVVVIGEDLNKELFGAEEALGKKMLINGQTVSIVGVVRRQTAFKGFLRYVERGALMPITFVQESLIPSETPFGRRISLIFLETRPGATIEQMTFQVTNLLRQRHQITGEDDFFIGNAQQILNVFNTIAAGLTVLLGLIAAISLLVGGINIMNIMLVSVKERTREIGLRKALGASEEVILMQFIIEAVLVSAVGGFIGMLFGIGLSAAIAAVSPLKPEVTPFAIILAVVVASGIGLFFGIFPARQAARLNPIDALRTE